MNVKLKAMSFIGENALNTTTQAAQTRIKLEAAPNVGAWGFFLGKENVYTTTLSAPIMTNKVCAPQLMGNLLLVKLHKTQIN